MIVAKIKCVCARGVTTYAAMNFSKNGWDFKKILSIRWEMKYLGFILNSFYAMTVFQTKRFPRICNICLFY